jgi:hypothetical protein
LANLEVRRKDWEKIKATKPRGEYRPVAIILLINNISLIINKAKIRYPIRKVFAPSLLFLIPFIRIKIVYITKNKRTNCTTDKVFE